MYQFREGDGTHRVWSNINNIHADCEQMRRKKNGITGFIEGGGGVGTRNNTSAREVGVVKEILAKIHLKSRVDTTL